MAAAAESTGNRTAIPAAPRWLHGDITLWLLGLFLFGSVLGPIIYLLVYLPWPQVLGVLTNPNAVGALVTSVTSASISTAVIAVTGIPLGYVLARYTFPGKTLATLIIYLPLIFPPWSVVSCSC